MKILHISDCQGDLGKFEKACLNESDIVVDSGDLLPNILHDGTNSGSKEDDIRYQEKFLDANKHRIIRLLKNRPFIFVQGNHDWIWLDRLNYDKLYQLNNSSITINNYKFYGFPNIPHMKQWNNYTEYTKFGEILNKIPIDTNILVTHTPPKDILDYTNHDQAGHTGIENLREKIRQTKIKLHLFGHVHESNGIIVDDNDNNTIYSNASRGFRIIKI